MICWKKKGNSFLQCRIAGILKTVCFVDPIVEEYLSPARAARKSILCIPVTVFGVHWRLTTNESIVSRYCLIFDRHSAAARFCNPQYGSFIAECFTAIIDPARF